MSPAVGVPLTIEVPPSRLREYGYAAELLFGICLGRAVHVMAGEEGRYRISGVDRTLLSGTTGRGNLRDQQLRCALDVTRIDISQELIRQGLPATLPVLRESAAATEGDLLLSAFYLGSGCWELDHGLLDQHQRVRGKDSWLERHGFLSLPVIHAYAELIRYRIAEAGLEIPGHRRTYKRWVTCDVDQPRDESCYSMKRMVRRIGRNAVTERSLGAMHRTATNYRRVQQQGWALDPNNTFDYLMAVNERHSNAMTFFLICGGSHQRDGSYGIDEPWMRSLMKSIHERGHALGLHGSFDSLRIPGQLRAERGALSKALQDLGITGPMPSRQHYLRWFPGPSVGVVEEAEISLDSTLGFHDACGFRRGMCCAFPLFDLERWQVSGVVEQPLVVMECAELGAEFSIPRDPAAVLDHFVSLARQCRAYSGTFTFLWHNSFLHQAVHKRMYETLASV